MSLYLTPLIIFRQTSEPLGSQTLAEGRLECYDRDGLGVIIPATSGAPGFQSNANYWIVSKGPLPPGQYTVNLEPEAKEARGIEGDFFRIFPVEVTHADGKTKRSGFGIHRDANAPGSAGCIVIIPPRLYFARFALWAAEQVARGEKTAKLETRYS